MTSCLPSSIPKPILSNHLVTVAGFAFFKRQMLDTLGAAIAKRVGLASTTHTGLGVQDSAALSELFVGEGSRRASGVDGCGLSDGVAQGGDEGAQSVDVLVGKMSALVLA